MPISDARMTTLKPTRNETRAPNRMREKTSRPRTSSPRRWLCDGASSRRIVSCAFGSNGASSGAAMAMSTSATVSSSPVVKAKLRRRRFILFWVWGVGCGESEIKPPTPHSLHPTPSFQFNSRIDDPIQQVAGKVHEDVRQCDDEDRRLHLRVIACRDRRQQQAAESG